MPSTHRAHKRPSKRAPVRAPARKRPQAVDHLDLVTRAIREGVYDWDVTAGKVDYSARVTGVLGLTREQLRTPADWYRRIHPEDRPGYDAALVAHFKGQNDRFECDYRYRAADGSWRRPPSACPGAKSRTRLPSRGRARMRSRTDCGTSPGIREWLPS